MFKTTRYWILFPALLSCTQLSAQVSLRMDNPGATVINKNIYGQFAEHLGRSIYDGFYYQGKIRPDVVAALKEIKVPNLRWPGGCFADQYHWKDGIGKKRPKTVNTTWGMVTEDNSFGTTEFLELCKEIGCEPYIAGNVGTGSPQEMKEWIEYLNFNGSSAMADLRRANGHSEPYQISLWGVGNESWGCGGNMTPEYYVNLYKHFSTFLPDYPGAPLKKIASGANGDDYHWTEVVMKNIGINDLYGYSVHQYTFPTGGWNPRGSATHFNEALYFHTVKQAEDMEEVVSKHSAIMDKYDPRRKVALLVDEWGVWNDAEPGTNPAFMYQQGNLRDALIAALTLNIFNSHADRVRGANLAQTVNVIHSLILTKGNQMIKTPTWSVFKLYQVHQDARLIPLTYTSPKRIMGRDTVSTFSASASIDKAGTTHLSMVNLDTKMMTVTGSFQRITAARVLTSAGFTDINTFEQPEKVKLADFNNYTADQVTLPPLSVVQLTFKL